MTANADDLKGIAQRWFDAINTGDVATLEQVVAYDVVDHSGLSNAHGYGLDGHKKLSQQLVSTFPGWTSKIDNLEVRGNDIVVIDHSGTAQLPQGIHRLVGLTPPSDPQLQKVDFKIKSCVRISGGKIVEHWAMEGPFGNKVGPDYIPGGAPGPDGGTPSQPPPADGAEWTPEQNKQFMQRYVQNVIDGMNPALGDYYFAQNFYNHDPAPGEQPGLEGVKAFIGTIFTAFSGFKTKIEDQLAEDDLVVGRWSQTFTNTGPYLSFPASNRDIHITGITITRIRDGRIVEEWEARDAVGLLVQMNVIPPLGPLEGGTATSAGGGGELRTINEAAVSRYFYEAWNAGNLAAVDDVVAPDFVNNSPMGGQSPGRDGLKQIIAAWHNAFPDMNVAIDLLISDNDRVAARWTLHGTHQNTFLGIKATGKYVTLPGISIFRLANGSIEEGWFQWEQAGMLAQLGVVQFPSVPTGGASPGGAESGTPSGGTQGGGTQGSGW